MAWAWRRCLPAIGVAMAMAIGLGAVLALAQPRPGRGAPAPGELPAVPAPRPAERERTGSEADWAAGIGWPAGLPAPRLPAIDGAGILTSRHRFPDGTKEIRARAGGTATIADVWPEWVARVRAAGGTVSDEHVSPASASASVCPAACAGGRFFVSMTGDAWIWLTLRAAATGAPPAVSGACVPIPNDSWRVCWTANDGRTGCSFGFSTLWDLDLDRDGIPDARVPQPRAHAPERTCPDEVGWDLYLSRGGCGHALGRIQGGIDLWSGPGAEIANGWSVLHATDEPAGPWDGDVTRRYEYRHGRYGVVAETRHPARCDVHPADCEESSPRLCALRGHPTIPGPYDGDAVGATLLRASQDAQAQCSAGIHPPVRCDVGVSIAPDGSARSTVRGCPAPVAACVARHFRPLRFPPYRGPEHPTSINFQLPAP